MSAYPCMEPTAASPVTLRRPAVRARGIGLIELMVSLVLGLLVALVASVMLISANDAYASQVEAVRLNDSGRFALETVSRAIRQAALVNRDRDDAPVLARTDDSANVGGYDARSLNRTTAGIEAPLTGAVNGSDVLAVRYFGAGAGSGGDGSVLNCAGFGVGAARSEAGRGWSIFYVASDADGEAELRCKYRGASSWSADAIVRGVDSFQVLYGIDTDQPADGIANRYVNASTVSALDAAQSGAANDAAAANRQTYWKRVVSIKIALLMHGERRPGAREVPRQFDLFGKQYADAYGASDIGVHIDELTLPVGQQGRTRQLLRSTVVLRNCASCAG